MRAAHTGGPCGESIQRYANPRMASLRNRPSDGHLATSQPAAGTATRTAPPHRPFTCPVDTVPLRCLFVRPIQHADSKRFRQRAANVPSTLFDGHLPVTRKPPAGQQDAMQPQRSGHEETITHWIYGTHAAPIRHLSDTQQAPDSLAVRSIRQPLFDTPPIAAIWADLRPAAVPWPPHRAWPGLPSAPPASAQSPATGQGRDLW